MNDFKIPVLASKMPKAQHDYPISERENLMRAFRHEKPRYVPCLYQATQFYIPKAFAAEMKRTKTKAPVSSCICTAIKRKAITHLKMNCISTV